MDPTDSPIPPDLQAGLQALCNAVALNKQKGVELTAAISAETDASAAVEAARKASESSVAALNQVFEGFYAQAKAFLQPAAST